MSEGRQQVRGSSLLVAGRLAAMVLGMVTQVLIVRALTKTDFGAFAYALALGTAARTFLSLGQGRLLSRFLATYEEERDYPRMFGALVLAVGTIVVSSALFISVLYLFSEALIGSTLNSADAVALVLVLIFLSPIEALDQVFVSLFAVFSKPGAIFFRKHLLAPGLRLVVVALLVVTDAGVMFLATGYVVAAAAGLLLYVGLLVPAMRARGLLGVVRPREVVLPYREVFSFSVPLITHEIALLTTTMGGVVILGLYHPLSDVAEYRSVFSSARLNTAVTASFATLFLPVIARFYAREDIAGLRTNYWQTAAFVSVLTFPIFALTGPLAPATTVTLFGERYADSAAVLSVLAVGYYLSAVLGFNAYTVQVCGRIRYLVLVNIAMAVINVGLCFLLAPRYAAVGIAVANTVAMVVRNLLNQWALRSGIQTAFIARECWSCYSLILLGAASLYGFDLLLSPGIVPSFVAAALVSLGVLAGSQRALQLGQTFPELRRIPLVGRAIR